jgi:hypothetical protein
VSFTDDLAELGFELVQHDRSGTQRFAFRSNAFLQWWVLAYPDGTAEVTWEFELGAYLKQKGFHISVQDELSLLLFPEGETRGPADETWVRAEIDRAAQLLSEIDLLKGT